MRPTVLAVLCSFLPAAALAAGSPPQQDTPNCTDGKVWDETQQQCVGFSGALPDEVILRYAYGLARDGRHAAALAALDLLRDPRSAVALNYRGYATRKLGRVDEGIGYYLQAVAADPTYVKVRQYLGEAYLQKGRVDLAVGELKAIGALCGTDCEDFRTLAEAIEQPGGW